MREDRAETKGFIQETSIGPKSIHEKNLIPAHMMQLGQGQICVGRVGVDLRRSCLG